MPGTVVVTGPYGYVGSRLRRRLDDAGWHTVALTRRPLAGDDAIRWTLGEEVPEGALAGVDALVHCAYDLTLRDRAEVWRVNVEGSSRLLDAASGAGVPRLMVISSMSAYEGTQQLYGQAKLAIEQRTLELGGVAVRPGLVYGPDAGGMVGMLQKLTRLPVVPVLSGGGKQYPVHEDDLVRVLAEVLSAPTWTSEVFGVAQPEALSFPDVLRGLAAVQGRRCRLVPVPWQAAHAGLRLLELLHVPFPLRSDSVAGLVRPAPSVPGSVTRAGILCSLRVLGAAGVVPTAGEATA